MWHAAKQRWSRNKQPVQARVTTLVPPANAGPKPKSIPKQWRMRDPWRFARPIPSFPAPRPYEGPRTVEEEWAETIGFSDDEEATSEAEGE